MHPIRLSCGESIDGNHRASFQHLERIRNVCYLMEKAKTFTQVGSPLYNIMSLSQILVLAKKVS